MKNQNLNETTQLAKHFLFLFISIRFISYVGIYWGHNMASSIISDILMVIFCIDIIVRHPKE